MTKGGQTKASSCYILLLIIWLLPGMSTAQEINHNQVWLDATGAIPLSNKLTVSPELGYRSEPLSNLDQFYLRTYLGYSPHQLVKLNIGVGHFTTLVASDFKVTEIRTSEFLSFCWPQIGGFKVVQRVGLDQRMYYQQDYDYSKTIHRSRYRIGLKSPMFSVLGSGKKLYSSASFELLSNINNEEVQLWIDHDWITIIMGAKISKTVNLEGHVLLINKLDPEMNKFQREISVFRLRLKYNFQ